MNDGVKGDGSSLGGNHRRRPEIFARHVVVAPATNHQITIGAINLEAADPTSLAKFWAAVTGAESLAGGDNIYLPPNGPGESGCSSSLRLRPAPSTKWPTGI